MGVSGLYKEREGVCRMKYFDIIRHDVKGGLEYAVKCSEEHYPAIVAELRGMVNVQVQEVGHREGAQLVEPSVKPSSVSKSKGTGKGKG